MEELSAIYQQAKELGVDLLMKAKQEYIDALECITKEYYSTVRFLKETNKFNSYLRLFKGLVNEHFEETQENHFECFEEKEETNLEHFEDDIATVGFDFAIKDGKIMSCKDCCCSECRFDDSDVACYTLRLNWLYQAYEEKIRLTQFEYDLINTYSDCHARCKFSDCKQLRKLKDKGYFKSIDYDTNIHDVLKKLR